MAGLLEFASNVGRSIGVLDTDHPSPRPSAPPTEETILPPRAQDRWAEYQHFAATVRGEAHAATVQSLEAAEARREAGAEADRVRTGYHDMGREWPDDVKAQHERTTQTKRDAAERAAISGKRKSGQNKVAQATLLTVEKGIGEAVRSRMDLADAKIKMPKDHSPEALAKRRQAARIAYNEAETAYPIIEEAQDEVRALVTKLAGEGPKLRRNHRGALYLDAPLALLTMGSGVPDALSLVAWAMPEKLLAHLEAQLQREYAGKVTMTAGERHKRLAAARAELLELDRIECELVWAAHEQNDAPLVFPKNASAFAILGVEEA